MSKQSPHTDKEIKDYVKSHTHFGTGINGVVIYLDLNGRTFTMSGHLKKPELKQWAYGKVKEYFSTRL